MKYDPRDIIDYKNTTPGVKGLSSPITMYTNRIEEIKAAIERYIAARYTIPQEWIDELNTLIGILLKEEN